MTSLTVTPFSLRFWRHALFSTALRGLHRGVAADVAGGLSRSAEGIERVHQCILGRFRRPEHRRRALDYLKGLLSPLERN